MKTMTFILGFIMTISVSARNNHVDASVYLNKAKVIRKLFLKDTFCHDRHAKQKIEDFQLSLIEAKTVIEKGGLLADKQLVESYNRFILKSLFESQVATHWINERHYLLNGQEAPEFMITDHLDSPKEAQIRIMEALESLRKELDPYSEKKLNLLGELFPEYEKIIRNKYDGGLDLSDLRHPDDPRPQFNEPMPISIQEK